jgi:hypothetical protein
LAKNVDLAQGRLRADLNRSAAAGWTGVVVVKTVHGPGQIHLSQGDVSLVVLGGLTGPEALAVCLAQRQGSYRFEQQEAPQGDQPSPLREVMAEADAMELRTAELLDRAPSGSLDADPARLLQRLNRLSDDVAWILRLIDGKRDMAALWAMGGSRAVEGALSLIEDGILVSMTGSSRVLGTTTVEPTHDAEPESVVEPAESAPQLEDDFAWTLAVKGVSGLPESSLKEEGWNFEPGADEWDQLPDLDGGIESLLGDAHRFFKTQAPESVRGLRDGIEPMLSESAPATVTATQEFEPPPVLDDEEIFAQDDVIPPVMDEFDCDDELDAFGDGPETSSRSFDAGRGSSAYTSHSGSEAFQAIGTGHFGHDDEIDEAAASRHKWTVSGDFKALLYKRLKFLATLLIVGGLASYTTYLYSQRIKNTAQGKVVRPIPWDPSLKEPQPPQEPSTENTEKAVVDAGPSVAKKRVKKRRKARRRARRSRKAKRSRLRTGAFSKSIQAARMLRDDGDLEGAIQRFGEALKLKVGNAELSVAFSERGESHFSAGSQAKAIRDLQQAIALDASNSFALKTLGLIEYQNFKRGDASARGRARLLLNNYRKVVKRPDAAVERWLAELQ